MATLQLTDSTVYVRLTRFEKIAGLLRDVEVPRSAVRDVEAWPDGLAAARGLRAPGLGLPGLRKVGTWRRRGERSLVSVRRGQPALRIGLVGQRYDTLVIGADDADSLAKALVGTPNGTSAGA